MIVRYYMGWFEMVVIDLPLIIASFWSISAFYVIAHRELFPNNWKRAFLNWNHNRAPPKAWRQWQQASK